VVGSYLRRSCVQPQMRTARAAILILLIVDVARFTTLGAGVSSADLMIDPDVRELVRAGRARVLVMLQVGESSDEARRAEAIGRAQDTVLSRLPHSHASVVRRYTSVPMLALEIDAAALLALETMTDVVVAVKSDRTMTPQ
jgi:hypothetical protein